MVFNWFRRQYNESSEQPSTGKEPETSSPQESPTQESEVKSTEAETPAESTPNVSASDTVDMLAFAKAAYKNIQQKQQTDSVEDKPLLEEKISEEVAAITETVETRSPEVQDENIQDENINEPTAAVTIATEIETPKTEIITTQVAENIPEVNISETKISETNISETNTSETLTPATSSFLERAAAEREIKQERFIASAIEFPELEMQPGVAYNTATTPTAPETQPENNIETTTEIPDLNFDEGFMWSTEVLAAQGRRPEDISIEEINWLKKLRQGLDKTRRNLLNQLKSIVGQGPLNQAAVMEIEALLLQADVGVEATDFIIDTLQQKLREEVLPPDAAIAYLKQILRNMLDTPIQKSQKSVFAPEKETLNIWLMTGVNGAGKTTTIGKLAHLSQKSGYKTLIGAADTFRAAAVEQVKVWGSRSGVEVVSNPGKNTDPAAVVFDAINAATSRNIELLLVDTAGRLQNKKNLMDELSKIRRIIDKNAPNAKVESLLVLDATLGQNGLRQAEVFSQAAQLSGVVLTKLDGTAKGGVALAVVKQLGLPIRFIGAGEGIEDLRPFSSYEFVEALLSG
ncbi:signal recognition particle-docking protein FtsY [Calothrix sp. UHCC 0171]|uniref:signal recognition particle-docking protein FtsY n=1 Tax=Calothrix sp. UHCC 0171 TaxID=3110245 RepID=UPI002B21B22C|nr:signal recognition particle-docking protein FtsY [Calothrix sp. UHCC 0171]MEA5569486.1 signal recognition particle-docking protein FtsY [Calothrix sp. UHCC 0171]